MRRKAVLNSLWSNYLEVVKVGCDFTSFRDNDKTPIDLFKWSQIFVEKAE